MPKFFKDASFGTKPEDVVSTETPNDSVVIQRDNLTCAVPIATSIVLSLLLTIVLNVLARLGNR